MRKQLLFAFLILSLLSFSARAQEFYPCYNVLNTTNAGNITATTAEITWYTNDAFDETPTWEILLVPSETSTPLTVVPPTDPVLENGTLLFTSNSAGAIMQLTVTNLVPATMYKYYIRSVCPEGVKGNWNQQHFFSTSICPPVEKCNYYAIKSGDWNGAKIQVRQNGIFVKTISDDTVTSDPNGFPLSLCNDIPFELFVSALGSQPESIAIKVVNSYGDLIYDKLSGEVVTSTTLFTSNVNCSAPTCPKPTGLSVTVGSTTQSSAELNWVETGSATQWEVYAAIEGSPAPINGTPISGIAPYYIANSNPFIVTGLQPGIKYIYYVRAICSTSDIGTWTILNPKIFATKPVNDESINSILVSVNPDSQSNLFTTGNTVGATASIQGATCPGNEDDDVWYKFIATSTLHIIKLNNISGASTDMNHSLFSGEGETMTQLYCSNPNLSLATNLIIGNTYTIRVYTHGTSSGNGNNPINASFDLYITTPPPIVNDECNTAITIPVSDSVLNYNLVAGAVTGATASAQVSTCTGSEDDDVWYEFVAPSTSCLIQVENILDDFPEGDELKFSVFSGNYCESLTQLYCVTNEILINDLVIGQTYKIRVWSSSNVKVESKFNISVSKTYPPLQINTTQFTNEQLVTNVLVNNPCVDISNITSSTGTTASTNGIGYFTNTNPFFPITSGVVLSTGNAANAGGPNTTILSDGGAAGDTDLSAILSAQTPPITGSLNNATKLEFDFTSQNEFMSFNFLFASEEYGVYQCGFADAFAFLLTDLVTNTTTNLAVVPGTNSPISVVTIRDDENNPNCTSQNESFFDTYFSGALAQTAATNFNGQTALMSASSEIIPNNPYHIKLVIADKNDTAYDSAVFIQAGSFSSGPPQCIDKVNLVAFVDANNNGTKEDAESSFTYGSFVYQVNNTGDINNISSPIGNYAIYDANPLNSYDFTYQVHPEYATYFSAGTISHNDITIPTGSGTQTLYFPITQIQGYNDVTVSIVPIGQPTAGFSYTNKIVYKNLGTATTSGTITY